VCIIQIAPVIIPIIAAEDKEPDDAAAVLVVVALGTAILIELVPYANGIVPRLPAVGWTLAVDPVKTKVPVPAAGETVSSWTSGSVVVGESLLAKFGFGGRRTGMRVVRGPVALIF